MTATVGVGLISSHRLAIASRLPDALSAKPEGLVNDYVTWTVLGLACLDVGPGNLVGAPSTSLLPVQRRHRPPSGRVSAVAPG